MKVSNATYRIQFTQDFGFQKARDIAEYLPELGISSIYASPIFKAKKGSPHGYDVVDQNQLNPELGTAEDFEELSNELKKRDMGWIQDIVPNHMAFDGENSLLMDVLENGQSSAYQKFFDIEWNHPYESMRGKLLTPFLGRLYAESLENDEILLKYDSNGFTINYYDLKLPLRIESYTTILNHRFSTLKKRFDVDSPDYIKLLGVFYVLKNLQSAEDGTNERYDQIRFVKRLLWELYTRNQEIRKFLDDNIELFNGEKGDPQSFNLLNSLLSEQNFILSFWKVASEEINYRRFFNINQLISLRIEDEDVFKKTHALIFKLVEEGKFDSLRIDHIDGLYDPTNYLKRLKEKFEETYIVVEKILDIGEEIPRFWPVQGTTGYEFLNYVNGLFCNKRNERAFNAIYSGFTDSKTPYDALVADKKRLIVGKSMAGDIDNVAHILKRASSKHRHGSDITLYGLRRALVEIMSQFPVYRTYISKDMFSEADGKYVEEAVKRAKNSNPGLSYEIDFIERFLLRKFGDYMNEEEREQCFQFIMKFQQFTGPLMAKGLEDTTFYVYNRFISLNEVGGNPSVFGISPQKFHEFNKKRAELWPYTMNATATHDTKRGEDVRARMNVLSEIPDEWEDNVKKWTKLNRKKKKTINDKNIPDKNDEYFLYQTLIGTFPFYEEEYPAFFERIKSYAIKAVREAKVHTAWLKPDTNYEDAFISFIEKLLELSEQNQFLREFLPFQKKIAYYGILNSLSQTLIKIASPGVPDFYQGTELWDLNLVDPDNRRPVDFEKRMRFLAELKQKEKEDMTEQINELTATPEDGRIKLFLIYRALEERRRRKELFENGDYSAIQVSGKFKDNIIAFARRNVKSEAIVIAPRFMTSVVSYGDRSFNNGVWGDTQISVPDSIALFWRDAFTNQAVKGARTLSIGEVLKNFPVALLMSENGERKMF